MASFRSLAVLCLALAIALPSKADNPADDCTEACWERCFQTQGSEVERYKEVYDNILEIILEINQLTKIYNVTKLGILLDTAMSDKRSVPEDITSGNLENAHNTFHVYFLLMQALLVTVSGVKTYVVQYNEESAWGCDELMCMDITSCQSVQSVKYLTPIELRATSHCPGAIEAGCKYLHDQMNDVPCTSANDNRMVIAITNGDININHPMRRKLHHHRHSDSDEMPTCPSQVWTHFDSSSGSDERDFFSPCHSYFSTRYAIGTHTAKRESMELFTSKHGNYRYFHDDEFTLNALDLLVYCMTQTTTCCPTTGTPALKTCSKTQGLFGETTSSYANHPGIGAKAPIIDYPVIPGGAIMTNVG